MVGAQAQELVDGGLHLGLGQITPRELNNFVRLMEQTGEPVIVVPKVK